ncbi:hypothetical protein ACEWY4_027313 [Coilia grayii]|uniref:Transposase Helix-turn-helix domain-containing protein n=1 Tax=Coilia grayii TaxID=363190 RepID=A0ABD1ISI1_9TELE
MKLRLNLLQDDITKRFGVSQTLVSRTFSHWLEHMEVKLRSYMPWMGRSSQRCHSASRTIFQEPHVSLPVLRPPFKRLTIWTQEASLTVTTAPPGPHVAMPLLEGHVSGPRNADPISEQRVCS